MQSTPWLSGEELAALELAEHALDKLHNSGRFATTLRWLTGEGGYEPFALFLMLGKVIQQAEVIHGRLSLDELTDGVFGCLIEKSPQHQPLLRDLLLQDRLASTSTTVLPVCLKQKDARFHAVKRALGRLYPRDGSVMRAIGFLYAGETDRVVFCDYIKKDPVTGLYPLQGLTVEECLAIR